MARVLALPVPRVVVPRATGKYLLVILLLVVVGFLTAYPTFLIFMKSFQITRPGEATVWGLKGWEAAFTDPGIKKALITTFALSAVRMTLETGLAIFFAWVITRTDTPFKGGIEFMLWMGYFLPALPMVLGWVLLLDPHYGLINKFLMANLHLPHAPFSIYSYGGIIWAHLAFSTAIRFLLITPAFRAMDAALEEAARTSGCSNFKTLLRITIPVLMPTLFAVTALGFIKHLESFEVELILGFPVGIRVYSTKIWEFLHWEPPRYPEATAMSSLFLVVIFAMILLQRRMLSGRRFTTISGKGYSVRPTSLGRWRWVTFGVCMLFITVLIILPLALLILGTFMKLYGFFNIPHPWTTRHWTEAFDDPVFMRSFKNTLMIGAVAAGASALIYALISYVLIRVQFVGKGLLDLFLWLPWALPGILMSLALLWLFLGSRISIPLIGTLSFIPIYGTIWLIIIALIINEAPVATRILSGSIMQISTELEESARVSGASWFYTFRRIYLPLMAPAMVAIGLISFISAIRSISTIVLLATFKSRTLSLLMLDYIAGAEREKATVIGVFLVIIIIIAAVIGRFFGLKMGPGGSRG